MGKPLATLHAGLVARATPRPTQPTAFRRPPVAPASLPRPAAPAGEPDRLHWQRPRVIPLRPVQIEVMPAPVSETIPAVKPVRRKRRATTLRLEPHLHARLRLAREQLDRTGQSILVEALNDWLATHETSV